MVLPLCKLLRARGWRVTLLALTTAAAKARAAGEVYIGFSDLKHHAAAGAEDYARQLCPNPNPNGPVSIEETLAYHGANFADLATREGEAAARALWDAQGRQAFLPIDFMTHVLTEYSPDVVIATNSPRTEKATVIAAGRLGIPALCVVDLFALQEVKWIGKPGFANRVAVLNETVRALMIDCGRSADEVIVTGNPALDAVNDRMTIEAGAALRAAKGWNDGRLTILWASTVEPDRHPFTGAVGDPSLPRRAEAALREIVKNDDRLRLVVRYHPSEQIAFTTSNRVEFSPVSEPLHPLLHAVDLVTITASTVGLEAWLARRPLISVDRSVFTADAPYSQMGISVGVESPEALAKMVQDMAGKLPIFPLSGQVSPPPREVTATEAIVAAIEKIAKIERSS
ncbi:MAG: hypothetical protein ACRCY3_16710 [Sphingorhabdus sp.]